MFKFMLRQSATAALVLVSLYTSAAYADGDQRFYNGRDDDWYDGRGFFDAWAGTRRKRAARASPVLSVVEAWTKVSSRIV